MVEVKDVMSKEVQTISKDTTIYKAAEQMSSKGISCLVVVEGTKIEGILTRRDILEKVMIAKKNAEEVNVAEVMTSPVKTINDNSTLLYAAGVMNYRRIKQLPVVNEQRLVGIVTQTDVVLNINTMLGYDKKNIEIK